MIPVLHELGIAFEPGPRPREAIVAEWWRHFAGANAEDRWKARELLWHVFSYRTHPCLVGEPALVAYEVLPGQKVILFTNDPTAAPILVRRRDFTRAVMAELQSALRPYNDLYLTASNFAWTLVRTHEEAGYELGPYFSRSGARTLPGA